MTRKLFGTDGVRGRTNLEPMTAETVLKIAMAAATQLRRGDHRHRVVIGKDTRLSGYMLEPALAAGFTSMGLDVIMVGPLPTPAVAMLTRSLRADLGVMISASLRPTLKCFFIHCLNTRKHNFFCGSRNLFDAHPL